MLQASRLASHHQAGPRLVRPLCSRRRSCKRSPCAPASRSPARNAVPETQEAVADLELRRNSGSESEQLAPRAPHSALSDSAGQPSSSNYDYFDHWYPIAFVDDIDKKTPYRFVLLEIPLVVWWDKNAGTWNVFKDVCPHRLVPLSEGRVNDAGQLECGYHGWTFSASGKCESIPQGGATASPRACATAYPAAVKQGLLFVRPKALPNAALRPRQGDGRSNGHAGVAASMDLTKLPLVEELNDPEWVSQDTWRDVPYDWSTLLENVLDASHVPFTHHKSISNRNVLADYIIKLTNPVTVGGFAGIWQTGPRAGKLGPQASEFRPPCYMQHKINAVSRSGIESMVVVYAVPTVPGACRLINRNLFKFHRSRLPAMFARLVPKWAGHIGSQVPLEDDQIFLHTGEREYAAERAAGKSATQAYYLPSPADVYVTALRKWIDRFGNGGPFGRVSAEYVRRLQPRLTREQHLDRYSQHTANCAQCQAALQQLKTVRAVLMVTHRLAVGCGLLAAAVAITAASGGGGFSASAAAAVSGSLKSGGYGSLPGLLLSAGWLIAGGGGPQAQILRAAAWALLAGGLAVADWFAADVEAKFYTGSYPPPRNLAKD